MAGCWKNLVGKINLMTARREDGCEEIILGSPKSSSDGGSAVSGGSSFSLEKESFSLGQ